MEKKALNPKLLGGIAAVAVVMIIVLVVIFLNKGDDLTAIAVRLLHSEGEVTLTDDTGKEKSMLDDMSLFSGYDLKTGADGLVKLGLDETKLVTVNNNSKVGFEKQDKAIHLNLEEGQVYFNVQEKLADDESFDIETSTMVVGIRGTSGLVDATTKEIMITDGVVEIRGTNTATGGQNTVTLYAGQKVKMVLDNNKEGAESVIFTVEDATLEDLPDFALKDICDDEQLAARVAEVFNTTPEALVEEAEKIIKEHATTPGSATAEVIEEADEDNGDEGENQGTGDNDNQTPNNQTQTTDTGGGTNTNQGDSGGTTEEGSSSTTTTTDDGSNKKTTEDDSKKEDTTKATPHTVYVVASDANGGTYAANAITAYTGDVVLIAAVPNDGYTFSGWSLTAGDIVISDVTAQNTTFIMGGQDIVVQANFTKVETVEETKTEYTVSVSTADSSMGTVATSATKGYTGDSITLTATPEPGYAFKEWSVSSGGVSISTSTNDSGVATGTFAIGSENVSVVAVFELKNYTISFSMGSGNYGEVSLYSGSTSIGGFDSSTGTVSGQATMGTELTVIIKPKYYCSFNIDELPDSITNVETYLPEGGDAYYEGTYTVETYDYSADLPVTMRRTELTSMDLSEQASVAQGYDNVWELSLIEERDSGLDILPVFYISTVTNNDLTYVPNIPAIAFTSQGVQCYGYEVSDSTGEIVDFVPAYIKTDNGELYFERKVIDGESYYYYVDLGTGYVVPFEDGLGDDSSSLYLVITSGVAYLTIYEP